jgi:hypothetical protein
MLVLGAENDVLIPPDQVRMTARRYGVEAHILPGLGHGMMMESDWRIAADPIVAWLKSRICEETPKTPSVVNSVIAPACQRPILEPCMRQMSAEGCPACRAEAPSTFGRCSRYENRRDRFLHPATEGPKW